MGLLKGEHATPDSVVAPVDNAPPKEEPKKEASFGERFKGSQGEPDKTIQKEATTPDAPKTAEATPNKDVDRIKVNGEWKEINFADREAIKKDLELAHGARKWASDLDKVRKENAKIAAELAEHKKAMEKLDSLKKTNPEELWARLYGEDPSTWLAKRAAEKAAYNAATPEMREALDAKKILPELQKQMAEERAARESLAKEAKEAKAAAFKKGIETSIATEYDKVRFTGKIKDKDVATQLDDILHKTVKANLTEFMRSPENKDLEGIPQEVIRGEFERVSKFLSKMNEDAIDRVIQETDKARAEKAKANVQLSSGTPTTSQEGILEQLAKFGGRPSDFWKKRR
jgi:hypothetical protein